MYGFMPLGGPARLPSKRGGVSDGDGGAGLGRHSHEWPHARARAELGEAAG